MNELDEIVNIMEKLLIKIKKYKRNTSIIERLGTSNRLFFNSRFRTNKILFKQFCYSFFEDNGVEFNNELYEKVIDYYDLVEVDNFTYGVKLI